MLFQLLLATPVGHVHYILVDLAVECSWCPVSSAQRKTTGRHSRVLLLQAKSTYNAVPPRISRIEYKQIPRQLRCKLQQPESNATPM